MRLRLRRSRCSGCGRKAPIHDRSVRRWRHLDLGAQRCHLEAEIRRVRCPECDAKVEAVPFARPGARHTRDLEDVVAFLAQQTNKTMIAKLLRIDWVTVGRIVERVVADHVDETRLAGLVMIGVDEVSWRKRHRYLTCVGRPHRRRRRLGARGALCRPGGDGRCVLDHDRGRSARITRTRPPRTPNDR